MGIVTRFLSMPMHEQWAVIRLYPCIYCGAESGEFCRNLSNDNRLFGESPPGHPARIVDAYRGEGAA